jgi:hypothetical protein
MREEEEKRRREIPAAAVRGEEELLFRPPHSTSGKPSLRRAFLDRHVDSGVQHAAYDPRPARARVKEEFRPPARD